MMGFAAFYPNWASTHRWVKEAAEVMMSFQDILPYLPIVTICVGFSALFVALRVAFIRRDFWKTTLKLRLGFSRHSDWKKEIRRRFRRKPLSALFIFLSSPVNKTFELPLLIGIQNPSSKSVKDIVIELIYPERFVVTNAEFKKTLDAAFDTFRREGLDLRALEADAPTTEAFLAKRDVSIIDDMVKIRHRIDVLRPSEGIEFWEPFRVTIPPIQHRNSGIAGAAYNRIAEQIRTIDGMLDHCVVTSNAIAENYVGRLQRTSVCVARGSIIDAEDANDADEEKLKAFTKSYVLAHWLGRMPRIGVYFDVLPFPLTMFFGQRKDTAEIAEFMQLREDKRIGKVRTKKRKKTVAVVSRLDPLRSPIGYIWMYLPIYDYYSLPDRVTTSEEALRYVGLEFAMLHPEQIYRRVVGTLRKSAEQLGNAVDALPRKLKGASTFIRSRFSSGGSNKTS
jgi:hypothetical protein